MALCQLVALAAFGGPPGPIPLECGMRKLAFARAQQMQPWRDHRASFDALELGTLCGEAPPPPPPSARAPDFGEAAPGAYHVGAGQDFDTVASALAAWRSAAEAAPPPIVLHAGVHMLNVTMELGPADNGLVIQNAAGEEAWLSGGVSLGADLKWQKAEGFDKDVLVADLKQLGVKHVPGLFTLESHRRLTRARFPNADVETAQWGYDSPLADQYSIEAAKVRAWTKPAVGELPTFSYVDFTASGAANPVSPIVKDDSGMYTEWTSGLGGVCELWDPDMDDDGTPAGSYWCGNSSSGGWASVDKQAATTGQLQLPVGMAYDTTDPKIEHFAKWSAAGSTGAIVHAWHSQSWAMHMFNISKHDTEAGVFEFAAGGWQGGRNWCSCDQCPYAGPWCGEKQTPPNKTDDRLISGSWYVENVREELDEPGEWWFDESTQQLFLLPNTTTTTTTTTTTADGTAAPTQTLVVPVLQTLIRFTGTPRRIV